MIAHFDSKDLAADHLIKNGWSPVQGKNQWVSRDGTCRAAILTIPNTETVAVQVWENA